MVSILTKEQAALPARYPVMALYDDRGNVAQHFLIPGLVPDQAAFDRLMADEHFSDVIEREEQADLVANAPLDGLRQFAVSQRAQGLFLEWLAFVNTDLEPWTTGGAIHYRPHWARVCLLALALGEAEGLRDDDLSALCAAAMFHDSRRADPYLDTGHGQRAADYYAAFCAGKPDGPARQSEVGKTIRFDERIYQAIAWHDRDDEDGLQAIEDCGLGRSAHGEAPGLLLLKLFKDADGLDRVRLGKGGLDPAYLRTSHAAALEPYARELNQLNAYCERVPFCGNNS